MPYSVYLVEPTTLLDDLLEASALLYHRCVTVIQATFADQYFRTLRDRQAQDVLFQEEDLFPLRQELKALQQGMIREQQELRRQREEKVRAYVASLNRSPDDGDERK